MAIRRYYLAQAGADVAGEVAAPKPVIDLMLAEKYGWTPQEIDSIPELFMEQMMLVLNARLNVDAEMKMRSDHKMDNNVSGEERQRLSQSSFRAPNQNDMPNMGPSPSPVELA